PRTCSTATPRDGCSRRRRARRRRGRSRASSWRRCADGARDTSRSTRWGCVSTLDSSGARTRVRWRRWRARGMVGADGVSARSREASSVARGRGRTGDGGGRRRGRRWARRRRRRRARRRRRRWVNEARGSRFLRGVRYSTRLRTMRWTRGSCSRGWSGRREGSCRRRTRRGRGTSTRDGGCVAPSARGGD
ncbi:hypothetical protein BE221DRAFT_165162, partial [Ostreococcus tauri]